VSLIPEQEIIESDIIWYHNHLRSYRNRYLLETGAANRANEQISEEEMGDAFVIAHEVGHALGFPHNMGELAPMIRRVIETLRLPKKK
jgi:hypothetical protein